MGKYASAQVYGEGERPGATLAGMMHPNRERDTILEAQDEDGGLTKDPVKIVNQFHEYYAALCTTKITPDIEAIADSLTQSNMP
ncbi:hypothetical protein NDU88_006551 [Pleurodeles waltl]|uniref:Uncharacterized protein n=1 Tax=Pleurodeles waltl TaxID=8319 RepID=A0AAV7PIP3_PLEWA|nr:hypothetical protein NDU88_006551 [Pleurodeles waltl]